MSQNKENKDAYETIYNRIVLGKIEEAENYLSIYKCLDGKVGGKAKSLLKKYMLDVLCRLKSGSLETSEFSLEPRCARRKTKVIREISDVLE